VFLTSKSLKASFITLACQRAEVALRCNISEADKIPYLIMNNPAGAFLIILSAVEGINYQLKGGKGGVGVVIFFGKAKRLRKSSRL